MVVHRVLGGFRPPLRSIPVTNLATSKTVFKKTKPKNICRNIFGAIPGSNLRVASELIGSCANVFTHRWGFDPVKEIPVAGGTFNWTPVKKIVLKTPEKSTNIEDCEDTVLKLHQEEKLTSCEVLVDEHNPIQPTINQVTKTTGINQEPASINRNQPNQAMTTKNPHSESSTSFTHSQIGSLTPMINNLNLRQPKGTEGVRRYPPTPAGDRTHDVIEGETTIDSDNLKQLNFEKKKSSLRQTKITDFGKIVKKKRKLNIKKFT